ncbi:hypothetical protein VTL71DRAFT_9953 [Oculimacula yallundae]|uniref:Uncharacterized protein n=1 Tax=Oculimacula yallundae TaxID=86028 RepID=A0ABR4BR21_9HELO
MDESHSTSSVLLGKEDNHPLLGEEESNAKLSTSPKGKSHWIIYTTFVSLLLALFVSNALLWFHFQASKVESLEEDTTTLACGKAPDEARRLGCQLDVMVYAWTPPPCLNNTHALMYFHSKEWPFWRHENRTVEIPAEEILAGKYEGFFSTWPFHGAHCQYLLSRNLQVLPTGGPLNDYMRDRDHNTHCFDEVREPTDPRRTLEVGMAYSTCTVRKDEI